MRIKLRNRFNEKGSDKLWRNSSCSHNYVLQNPSMDHTERFSFGSIYFKDQVDKPKKIFTVFEKPDLVLLEFRHQVEQASHEKYYNALKKKQSRKKQKAKAKSLTSTVNSKFYSIPDKNQYKYDRHGIRSPLKGEYNIKEIQQAVHSARFNFGCSRRMDLSRPLNFYPGPGSYGNDNMRNTTRTLENRRTFSDFKQYNASEELSRNSTMRVSSHLFPGI